jgi:Spy/CpxP family protein refolding chaperone
MNRLKSSGWVTAAALLFTTFLAGALGGAAVSELSRPGPGLRARFEREPGGERRSYVGQRPDGRGRPSGPGMGVGRVPLLPPGTLDRLDLTDEQRASVEEILERRRAETEALLESVYPTLRAQVDSANEEIRAVLTSEQQEAFDRIRDQMRQGPPDGRGPRPPR